MKIRLSILILMVSAMILGSCTATKVEKPFVEVSVSSLSIHCPTSVPPPQAYKLARMIVEFKIHNPNNAPVILDALEYEIYGDGHAVAGAETMVRGEHLDRTITPSGTTNVELLLPYISKDEDAVIWSKMIKGNVTWRIKGVAHLHTNSVPFECTVKDYSLQIDERCK